ncbi:MAG: SBBP repeat-containing protein [Chloroflexia bacterium]|nr:SBBP repeat-containing protein [Chloroflexia bacterium]
MKKRLFGTIALMIAFLVLALGLLYGSQADVAAGTGTGEELGATENGVPLLFIENVGQFAPQTRFQIRQGNTTIHIAENEIWFTLVDQRGEDFLSGVHLRLTFPGANAHPTLVPFDRQETHVSFFSGSDPASWRQDVPVWGGVRYLDLYPGIDLEISGRGGRWTWRLLCQGRDVSLLQDIRLQVAGAERVSLGAGELRLSTASGPFRLPLLQLSCAAEGLPRYYPSIEGAVVRSPFAIQRPGRVPQPLDNPDEMLYGTYLGGSEQDWGHDVAIDGSGAAYLAGQTSSTDFPATSGAFSETLGGTRDAFVAKLSPNGNGSADLVYATFLGGSGGETAGGIAVDASGNALVTGWSNTGFPDTPGVFGDCSAGGAFVSKLNASGSDLIYSGCVTGLNAAGHALALDSAGQAYIVGSIQSGLTTTSGAYDTAPNGNSDAFLAIVSTDGTTLTYATYFGGSDHECAYVGYVGRGCTVALDDSNQVYISGGTLSSDLPTSPGAYDTICGTDGNCNSDWDAFVAKLNPAGAGASDLVYSTFLGGSGADTTSGIAVNPAGSAYVTGHVHSDDFPTTSGALSENHNGAHWDSFLTKLNPAGSALDYSTYLGGSGNDHGWDIAIDQAGDAYAIGYTLSDDFPTSADAQDSTRDGTDAYIVRLTTAGSGQDDLVYGTFLGGTGIECEKACAITVDAAGNVFIAGDSGSDDYPTSEGAYDRSYNGGTQDAFMARLPLGAGPQHRIYLPLVMCGYWP